MKIEVEFKRAYWRIYTEYRVEKLRNWNYKRKERQAKQIQKTEHPVWQTGADESSSD